MPKLIFDSQFATKGLLTSRSGSAITWATKLAPGDNAQLNKGTEAQYYFDQIGEPENCLSCENGVVTITAKPVLPPSNPLGMSWGSAALTTAGMAPIPVLGEKEIRCRLPRGPGMWPAFWTLPYSRLYTFERDILENFGCANGTLQMTQHGADATGAWQTPYIHAALDDMDKFHSIMERCTTDSTTLLINGKEVGGMPTLPGTLDNGPCYMIANLAVFLPNTWSPPPADLRPHHMKIVSIKAWE